MWFNYQRMVVQDGLTMTNEGVTLCLFSIARVEMAPVSLMIHVMIYPLKMEIFHSYLTGSIKPMFWCQQFSRAFCMECCHFLVAFNSSIH